MTIRRVTVSEDELEIMLENAAEKGAHRALSSLGLLDEQDHPAAARDIKDLRDILRAFRDIQTDAVRGFFAWIGRGFMFLLLLGLLVWGTRNGTLIDITGAGK